MNTLAEARSQKAEVSDGSIPTGRDPAVPALPLSDDEKSVLEICEATIRRGLKTFYEVGTALERIRDSKLYRAEFGTFEEYCQAKWDMGARHARQVRAAAEVVDDLKASGQWSVVSGQLPASESQARPLTMLPRDQRAAAWAEALQTCGGRMTASHIAAIVQRRLNKEVHSPQSAVLSPQSTVQGFDHGSTKSRPTVTELGTREEQIRAAADAALAELRSLQDLLGTADGTAAAGVGLAVQQVDELKDHLRRTEQMHAARPRREVFA